MINQAKQLPSGTSVKDAVRILDEPDDDRALFVKNLVFRDECVGRLLRYYFTGDREQYLELQFDNDNEYVLCRIAEPGNYAEVDAKPATRP